MSYDNWLEQPYQDSITANELFVDWCEDHDLDPEDPDSEDAFQHAQEPDWDEIAEQRAEAREDYELARMEWESAHYNAIGEL